MSALAYAGEPMYPVALMNWMIEGSFHALIVDKSTQRLTVWRIEDGEPRVVESFPCSTGENEGDKWVRGDMRTPEGVYFFCSVIDGRTLPPKYGLWAFTTDYPNFVDRRRGKNGDGIWLHGRDKPLGGRPDSNGCIALENSDLIKVSRYIRLQSTPLIIVHRTALASRAQIMEQERQARNFIETWRRAWESKDLGKYMAHYSPNFQSSWMDFNGWMERKRRLNRIYSKIEVKLGSVYLYRQDGVITAVFTQSYRSERFHAGGVKVLYMTDHPSLKIYAEDFHQQVDDACPVRTFLARVGETPVPDGAPAADSRRDFRIRLVSTDEVEENSREDVERPTPVAPSQGLTLKKAAVKSSDQVPKLALDSNERTRGASLPVGLITALTPPAEALKAKAASAVVPVRKPLKTAALPDRREARAKPLKSEKAAQNMAEAGAAEAAPATSSKPGPASPVASPNAPSSETETAVARVSKPPAAPSADMSDDHRAVLEFLARWKKCWEGKRLAEFMKLYDKEFQAGDLTYARLEKSKRLFFAKYRTIRLDMENVETRRADGRVFVKFRQVFQGDNYRDTGWKSMVLAGSKDQGFRILSERWSAL
jgi:murein L,D-transpeptidase YafK